MEFNGGYKKLGSAKRCPRGYSVSRKHRDGRARSKPVCIKRRSAKRSASPKRSSRKAAYAAHLQKLQELYDYNLERAVMHHEPLRVAEERVRAWNQYLRLLLGEKEYREFLKFKESIETSALKAVIRR